ncbi:MAG: STAS domain-containing protein [Oscillatoriales cyanobacterium SM2_2_1]|nr:STAS domain-containing protein [Oscillatoriales cyanobacterium SM2_2_1]
MLIKSQSKALKHIEVIEVGDSLVASNTSSFRLRVRQSLEKHPHWLLLDMAQTYCMDSAGLGAVTYVKRVAHSNKCHIAICGLQEPVEFVFTSTALMDWFSVHESREAFEQSLDH